jgi:hypothetical protein
MIAAAVAMALAVALIVNTLCKIKPVEETERW